MPRNTPTSLRTRLLLLVAAVVLASLAVMGVGIVEQRRAAVRRASDEVLRLSQMAAAYDHQAVESARQLLLSLGHTREVARLDGVEASRLFRRLLAESETFTAISAADLRGHVFASSHPAEHVPNVAEAAWYERALASRGMVVGGYQIGAVTGQPTFKCAYAARDSQGTPHAVVFADMDLRGFSRLARGLGLKPEVSLVVLDRFGVVVSHWPEPAAWAGRRYLPPGEVTALLDSGQGVRELASIDGVTRLVGFTAIGDPAERAMLVGVGEPRHLIVAAASRELLLSLLGLLFVGAAVMVLAARALDRMVLRPVETLVRAARRLGRGDFEPGFSEARARGELGELARALEGMAVRLNRHRVRQQRWSEKVRASEARKAAVLEAALDAIVTFDERGRLLEMNPAAERLFGVPAEVAMGRPVAELVLPPGGTTRDSGAGQTLRVTPGRTVETTAVRADRHEFPVELAVAEAGVHDGRRLYTAFVRDITERVRHEEALRSVSLLDPLTGLYNRRGFLTFAGQQLRLAERTGANVTLLFADLDGLKQINDQHGHAAGDRAIRDAASVLRDTFRESDVLGRMGGDEFVVLTLDAAGTPPDRLIARLVDGVDARNAAAPGEPPISFSVGAVQRVPGDRTTFSELLLRGDELMYAHKRTKRSRVAHAA
jgi:diguanylate cyclase (GGDEF)-like protein/PAS domain S-box-containing protein